ncbi:flagellar biosynthesis protein FlhF [Paraburkholderia caribensis]|uniref:Flagellar biosynthesis protein FlhF n=1 Tax=Paraburkholderia caribensis TaxID=75105 RepID=A0A9Q6S128_9BURK|nr:flagellar biosynthesis protein FlhF [Paraburkholderia caribensis]MCO4883093.1 flagellar biosynthesis protein FlhF [Paraburkholderia caribensis]PTB23606.1 flagellar biosynthesis protein FlhF [Paraburkholderia caribensis]QLB62631.1 flagellar biosynthesis protein FlhF [Paraburkholderia caribensis]
MNIRKFVGATSRDALRLVREALGSDAVVLSNRTNEDGSVEIVAVADRDLSAITPRSQEGAASQGTGPTATPAGARPMLPSMPVNNPYASGMPDVFSSVFGASPEAGTERMPASSEEKTEPQTASAENAAAESQPNPARPTDDVRVDLRSEMPAASAKPAAAAMPETSARQRTMAETNPWLIDHARRIASKDVVHAANPTMTPAAAMARGLGTPVDAVQEEAKPDWAREAAQLAARRATQKNNVIPTTAEGAGDINTSRDPRKNAAAADMTPKQAVALTESIKSRIEQMVNETVMQELTSMRGMMEEQFAGLVWADRQRRSPTHAALTRHLFAAGFSAQLVKMVIDNLPEVEGMDEGMEWVKTVLESNVPVMENEDALMERGGVFALMGPTGVGKTTTTAKLAARCVMRFGASKVALLTTDSYRIGGHEQLRIFGKILCVSVHAVKDSADLQLALSELRNKHIVLIDTIGMSQRDRLVSDQISMLCRAGQPVQRLLLLNATSHGDTLNEVVQAYQNAPDQQPLAGCILTKLDEATNLGSVLDTVIRYKLPVHYVSTGQKVPENLYVATKKFLIKSAFCIPRENSPFVPQDEDVPALLSALSARSTADLHEVRFG